MVMNKSEGICFAWLKAQGYKDVDIVFSTNKSPDFVCSDGKKYEAKRLYGNQILFYSTQIDALNDVTIVVVDTSKESVIRTFNFSDKENQKGIEVKIVDYFKGCGMIRISQEARDKLKEIGKKDENYDEIIRRLIDESHEN